MGYSHLCLSLSLAPNGRYLLDTPTPFAPKWRPKSPLDWLNIKPIHIRRSLTTDLRFTPISTFNFTRSIILISVRRREREIGGVCRIPTGLNRSKENSISKAPTEESALMMKQTSQSSSNIAPLTSFGFPEVRSHKKFLLFIQIDYRCFVIISSSEGRFDRSYLLEIRVKEFN